MAFTFVTQGQDYISGQLSNLTNMLGTLINIVQDLHDKLEPHPDHGQETLGEAIWANKDINNTTMDLVYNMNEKVRTMESELYNLKNDLERYNIIGNDGVGYAMTKYAYEYDLDSQGRIDEDTIKLRTTGSGIAYRDASLGGSGETPEDPLHIKIQSDGSITGEGSQHNPASLNIKKNDTINSGLLGKGSTAEPLKINCQVDSTMEGNGSDEPLHSHGSGIDFTPITSIMRKWTKDDHAINVDQASTFRSEMRITNEPLLTDVVDFPDNKNVQKTDGTLHIKNEEDESRNRNVPTELAKRNSKKLSDKSDGSRSGR